MSEKLILGVRVMEAVASEMKDAIAVLAGERTWSDTRQSWLSRAARRAGISVRSASRLWYGEASNPSAITVEKIRRAIADQNQRAAHHGREEARDIVDQLRVLAERLERVDPEFFGEVSAAIRKSTSPPQQSPD